MASPTTVSITHSLGRDEAKRRIQSRIGELARHIPGGVTNLQTAWPSPYRLTLDLGAMGQSLAASLDIEERSVIVTMVLPPLLAMMSGMIARGIQDHGQQLGGDKATTDRT